MPTDFTPEVQPQVFVPWSWDGIPISAILITINVVVYVVAVLHQLAYGSLDPIRFGADYAPLTLAGQWWRLLTSQFLQVSLGHLLGNMLLLGLLGTRVQKLLGPWTYLFFYLACGTAASLAGLAAFPLGLTFGASGATYGLTGGIAVFYGLRFSSLARSTQWKLILLLAVAVVGFFPDFGPLLLATGMSDYPSHIAGMAAGLALAFALRARPQARSWIIATTVLLLVAAAATLRCFDSYAIPLGRAAEAYQAHHLREAETQINLALAQRPGNLKVLQQATAIYTDAYQVNEAEVFNRRALAIEPNNDYTLTEQVFLYQHTGRCEAARPIIDRLHAMHSTLVDKVLLPGPCAVWEEAAPPNH